MTRYYRATPDGYVEECSEDDADCLGKDPGDRDEDFQAGYEGGVCSLVRRDGSHFLVRIKHTHARVEPDHAFEGLTPDEPCAHPGCGKRESAHRFTPPGVQT